MWGCAEFYLPFWPVKFLRKSLLLKCQASANQIMIFDTLLLTSFSVLAAIMRGEFRQTSVDWDWWGVCHRFINLTDWRERRVTCQQLLVISDTSEKVLFFHVRCSGLEILVKHHSFVSVIVLKTITRYFKALTSELSIWTLVRKFHLYKRLCIFFLHHTTCAYCSFF